MNYRKFLRLQEDYEIEREMSDDERLQNRKHALENYQKKLAADPDNEYFVSKVVWAQQAIKELEEELGL